jgi:callose synthase
VARALELARRRAAWLLPGAGSSLSDIVALYTAAGDDDDIRPDTGGEEGSSLGRAWREAASAAPPLPPRVVADAAAALGTAPVARLLSLSSASALAFGFQPSVVSHQCEHLLGLLSARAARPGGSAASAAVAVHAALFAPYLLWCDHVGAVPQCSRDGAAPEACEAETLLFLLIWAEAANLRHAPEAVWWVYHQLSTDGRLPAPFLPAVIAPLYSASLVLMRKREPALNYDDLNEAFWHPRCLAWALVGSGAGSASSELLRLRKTYRERRSWLHVLGSFERVYFAHWLLLRGVLCAAVGAHTCVAAEFGAICDAKRPAQSLVRMLQLEATCVVDLQVGGAG